MVVGLLLSLAMTLTVRADVTRFDLSGTVTDSTGGVLPGVTVTLKNTETGFSRSVVTDSAGRYTFTAVPPDGQVDAEWGARRVRDADARRSRVPGQHETRDQFPAGGRRAAGRGDGRGVGAARAYARKRVVIDSGRESRSTTCPPTGAAFSRCCRPQAAWCRRAPAAAPCRSTVKASGWRTSSPTASR